MDSNKTNTHAVENSVLPRKRIKTDPTAEMYNSKRTYDLPEYTPFWYVAKRYPELQTYLVSVDKYNNTGRKSTLDFKNPDAVRTLNKALLRVYFDLDVTIPNESLCPPVANRLNYIKWIKSNIVAEFWPGYSIRGLDIGTGASCIYPLLGARVLANSSFIGTDVNSTSIAVANQNIAANSLENRIQTYLNTDRQTKLPIDNSDFPINWDADADGSVLLFNMCNPPFYDSPEERQRLRDTKSIGQPSLDINGKDDELYTEGGEEMFLSGLVDESAVYQKRIKWYSTMIGKKKTLALLKTKIRSVGAKHIKEGLLIQGRTTRWVLAWSFLSQTRFCLDLEKNTNDAHKWFKGAISGLGIAHSTISINKHEKSVDALTCYECSAFEKSWTRQWRRQQIANSEEAGSGPADADADGTAELSAKIPILKFVAEIVDKESGASSGVNLYLNPGFDSNMLMSLYNHLSRKATST